MQSVCHNVKYFNLGPCANIFFGHVGTRTGSPHLYLDASVTLKSCVGEASNHALSTHHWSILAGSGSNPLLHY